MPESGTNAVECTIYWANDTNGTLQINCEGFATQMIDPGGETPALSFRAAHNTSLDMVFTFDDGTATTCQVKWRTVADKFALTQKNGDEAEFAIPWLVAKTRQNYCIHVQSHGIQGGLLIVGTIDTK